MTRGAQRAVARFPQIEQQRRSGLPQDLIVNLTSYPVRYPTLAATIRSLLDQSVRAERTVLWLGWDNIDALPEEVLALRDRGLEIRGCEDIGPYTKLLPALALWPDAFLVTADDDVYYPPDWLLGLCATYDPASPAIVAWRAHLAKVDALGRVAPYAEWEMATSRTRATDAGTGLFPTGVGGVLYPPGSLPAQVLRRDLFQALCPRQDDVWLYWMARLKGTPQVRVAKMLDLIEWPSSQSVGLRVDNVGADGNDRHIRAMEEVFGAFPLRASAEN
ncbi:glycosyltransferase family 2 protein [Sphingomonas koreensis]|nr:glycosyltransferase family 2 protein [Sphingomonas koreensis]